MRMQIKLIALVCLLLVSTLIEGELFAKKKERWSWQLSASRYKKLNTFQRALYKKAKHAFEKRQYREAATLFEKFKVEHDESPILSYIIFMHGYSLHHAKDRNKAIRTYNEVLDYFPGVIEDASPALFYLGKAHFDNGQNKKGMLSMKEMAEDEDYREHALAAGALLVLAENHWKNKEKEKAIKYWRQIVDDFSTSSPKEAANARHSVYCHLLVTQSFGEAVTWLAAGTKREDAGVRRWILNEYIGVLKGLRHNWKDKAAQKSMYATFWTFYKEHEKYYTDNYRWKYLLDGLDLCGDSNNLTKEREKWLGIAVQEADKTKEPTERDSKIKEISDLFLKTNIERSYYLLQKMKNQTLASFYKASYLQYERKYQGAYDQHLEVEKLKDKELSLKSLAARAHLLHIYLNKPDEAIKLYEQISAPPGTLWNIADCYKRLKKHENALRVYSTIESSFPPEGAKAAWARADHCSKIGERKKAVGEARRILKVYPKKREASYAHQLLEKYGIATGGGLIED